MEIKKLYSFLGNMVSGIVGRTITVMDVVIPGALGYTSQGNRVHVASRHPIFDGMTEVEADTCRIGIAVHEALHQVFTNFSYDKRKMEELRRSGYFTSEYDEYIYHELMNLVEDPAIESMAPEVVGGIALKALRATIRMIDDRSDYGTRSNDAISELTGALIQFGDIGLVRNNWFYPEARQCFLKISGLFYDAINDPDGKSRVNRIRGIHEIVREIYPKVQDVPKDSLSRTMSAEGSGSGRKGSGVSDSEVNKKRKITIKRIKRDEWERMKKEQDEKGGSDKLPDGDITVYIPDEPVEEPSDSKSGGTPIPVPDASGKSKKNSPEKGSDGKRNSGKTSGKNSDKESSESNSDGTGSTDDKDEKPAENNAAAGSSESSEKDKKNISDEKSESGDSDESGSEGSKDPKNSVADNEAGDENTVEDDSADNGGPESGSGEEINDLKSNESDSSNANSDSSNPSETEDATENNSDAFDENTKSEEPSEKNTDDAPIPDKPDSSKSSRKKAIEHASELTREKDIPEQKVNPENHLEENGNPFELTDDEVIELSKDDFSVSEEELEEIEAYAKSVAEEMTRATNDSGKRYEETDGGEAEKCSDIVAKELNTFAECNNIIPQTTAEEMAAYEKVKEPFEADITMLQDELREIFHEDSTKTYYAQSGRVNLKRMISGTCTTRLFERKERSTEKESIAVYILVDMSGSTRGEKIAQERLAAILTAETLSEFDIPVYVTGFTENPYAASVLHFHFVRWDNTQEERASLMKIAAGGNNFDAYAIRFAEEMLKERKEKRKLMIVISDGLPASTFSSGRDGMKLNAETVKHAQEQGINVICFGVGDVSKKDFEYMYGKKSFISVKNPAELFNKLAPVLRNIIDKTDDDF